MTVDRERPSLGERLEEALDLSSHLRSNLSAQPRCVPACKSSCPECRKPSIESSAAVNEQIKLLRRRKGRSLEQIQMQADREVWAEAECGDRVFPGGTVNDDAGAAERSPVMAGHNRIRDAFGQTAVVGMKNRNKPRWTADSRWSNRGHG